MSNKKRILCISDLHGTFTEFQNLLTTVQYNQEQDRLIIVGDAINRGPNSLECIRYIRENNIEMIMGNHEWHFVRWYKGKQDPHWLTTRPHYALFKDEDITFLNNLPLYLNIPEHNLWVVHAGVRPNVPLEKQRKEDLLYLRYVDEEHKTIPLKTVFDKTSDITPRFWTEFGPFGANIVAGHCVFLDGPKMTKYEDGSWVACIDTGCCFGNYLSCLIIKNSGEQEIVQVKAKEVYYTNKFSID